jgi:adenylate kinase
MRTSIGIFRSELTQGRGHRTAHGADRRRQSADEAHQEGEDDAYEEKVRRDPESEAEVEEELTLSREFLVVAAATTGATMTIVNNRENRSDEAVEDLVSSLNLRP